MMERAFRTTSTHGGGMVHALIPPFCFFVTTQDPVHPEAG